MPFIEWISQLIIRGLCKTSQSLDLATQRREGGDGGLRWVTLLPNFHKRPKTNRCVFFNTFSVHHVLLKLNPPETARLNVAQWLCKWVFASLHPPSLPPLYHVPYYFLHDHPRQLVLVMYLILCVPEFMPVHSQWDRESLTAQQPGLPQAEWRHEKIPVRDSTSWSAGRKEIILAAGILRLLDKVLPFNLLIEHNHHEWW